MAHFCRLRLRLVQLSQPRRWTRYTVCLLSFNIQNICVKKLCKKRYKKADKNVFFDSQNVVKNTQHTKTTHPRWQLTNQIRKDEILQMFTTSRTRIMTFSVNAVSIPSIKCSFIVVTFKRQAGYQKRMYYKLNEKQKKGETIDTCVNAVIDREFNPPMRFALESMSSVINVERARYMSCCQAPSYHFTI